MCHSQKRDAEKSDPELGHGAERRAIEQKRDNSGPITLRLTNRNRDRYACFLHNADVIAASRDDRQDLIRTPILQDDSDQNQCEGREADHKDSASLLYRNIGEPLDCLTDAEKPEGQCKR